MSLRERMTRWACSTIDEGLQWTCHLGDDPSDEASYVGHIVQKFDGAEEGCYAALPDAHCDELFTVEDHGDNIRALFYARQWVVYEGLRLRGLSVVDAISERR